MAEKTINLELPYILSSQAQKHITHNEALQRLDAMTQLVIQSSANTPPASPLDGGCYAVLSTPTDAWSGKAGRIAFRQDGAWIFLAPHTGWMAWFEDVSRRRIWTGSEWADLFDVEEPSHLGVNSTADTTNRLSVSAQASLFTHDGHGHQLKINKSTSTDTGSMLFQTSWSGRAEMGLAGSDNFELKVSADGSAWATALKTTSQGAVIFPNRPVVRAVYGETAMTPSSGSLTGFGTLYLNQGNFTLGAVVPSGSGSRLVMPVSGIYLITVNVSCLAASSFSLSAMRNGSTSLLTVRDSDSSAATYSQSATALAWFDAGDWLALSHSGTAELEFGYGKTEVMMALL